MISIEESLKSLHFNKNKWLSYQDPGDNGWSRDYFLPGCWISFGVAIIDDTRQVKLYWSDHAGLDCCSDFIKAFEYDEAELHQLMNHTIHAFMNGVEIHESQESIFQEPLRFMIRKDKITFLLSCSTVVFLKKVIVEILRVHGETHVQEKQELEKVLSYMEGLKVEQSGTSISSISLLDFHYESEGLSFSIGDALEDVASFAETQLDVFDEQEMAEMSALHTALTGSYGYEEGVIIGVRKKELLEQFVLQDPAFRDLIYDFQIWQANYLSPSDLESLQVALLRFKDVFPAYRVMAEEIRTYSALHKSDKSVT